MATLIFLIISITSFPYRQLSYYKPISKFLSVNNKNNQTNMGINDKYLAHDNIEETLFINGVEITLLDCRRDPIHGTLNFHLVIENSGIEAEISLNHASVFEREGDEFKGVKSGIFFSEKVKPGAAPSMSLDIMAFPVQTDYIRNLKFSVYNSNTEQEFLRNLRT